MASEKSELTVDENNIETLKDRINELNDLISLQQYYIDEWRDKYEDEKRKISKLKTETKPKQLLEQEIISLKGKIAQQNEIINSKNKTIYHLRNPQKWQWCDFKGYIWKDFDEQLSANIESSYQNDEASHRHALDPQSNEQMYEFKFNPKLQTKDNNRYLALDVTDEDENEELHRMVFYSSSGSNASLYSNRRVSGLHYWIQRVPISFQSNYSMDPAIWNGPARRTFGNNIMTLYHVTNKHAASIITKTRTMKCGQIGRFGGGIYFAEKVSTAQGRAHHSGYVITARVLVGKELVINAVNIFDFERIHNMGFDSIYAKEMTERVVYHCDQICIVDIKKMSRFKLFS
eukprot:87728_1